MQQPGQPLITQPQQKSVDERIAAMTNEVYAFEHSEDKHSLKQWLISLSKGKKLILASSIIVMIALFAVIWSVSLDTSANKLSIDATKSVTSGVAVSSDAQDDNTSIITNSSTGNPEDTVSDSDDSGLVDTDTNDKNDDSNTATSENTTSSSSWWQRLLRISKKSSSNSSDSSTDSSSTTSDDVSGIYSDEDVASEDIDDSTDSNQVDSTIDSTVVANTTLQNISYTKIKETPSPTGGTKYINGAKASGGSVIDTMQGGTSDGTYLYFAYENPVGGGTIAKFDLNGTFVKGSGVYSVAALGHANALTYDSRRHRLVMPTFRLDGNNIVNGAKLAYIDPKTLQVTQYITVQPKATISNICYNPATDQFAANGRLYDSGFTLIHKNLYNYGTTLLKKYDDEDSFGQGIACNSRYIYVIRYYANATKPHNHIYMFNWSGKLIGIYNVQGLKDESESIFIANGRPYMGVNNGSTYLGKTSDNKNDYFIQLNDLPL